MFSTLVSGLPELLFDKGCCTYKSFCMQAHSSHANTAMNLTSETSKPSNIIPFESQELSADSRDDSDNNAINMLFMLHENIILKDGKGITWEVMFLGPQNSDEILQHKVWNRNGHKYLVGGTLLSSMDVPDIRTVPVSNEQYANELQKLTREQLQHISHPQILDNDQKCLWDYITRWTIFLFLQWSLWPKKENSTENFPNSNTGFRFACLASLARLIANHGAQKGKKVRLESTMMCPWQMC